MWFGDKFKWFSRRFMEFSLKSMWFMEGFMPLTDRTEEAARENCGL